MQQQKARGFRGFVQTPIGRAVLIALTILVVFATFAYAGVLFAIPVFLIVGLAIPIYAGLKRPKYLALAGVVVILLVPPIATAVLTSELMTPGGASSSNSGLPEGHGGSVLQNAFVTPFTGSTSTNFTWNVTVYPQYLSPGFNSTPLWISLFISTCPGATGNDSPNCNTPYPFTNLTRTFTNATWTPGTPVTVSFHYAIGSDGLWYWQMGLAMRNLSTDSLNWIFLVGDPQFDGIEGPVIGNYLTVYSAVIGTVYLDAGLFLGGSYFFVLLLYVVFKNRQQRRADSQRRRAPPVPAPTSPTGGGTAPLPSTPAGGTPPAPPAATSANERSCPNCKAVVYENEGTCWKCGATLSSSKP